VDQNFLMWNYFSFYEILLVVSASTS